MLRTTTRILRVLFYAAVILLGVTFAVSNRGKVDLTFYPFPYIVSLPLFLFTIAVFAVGLFIGWMLAGIRSGHYRRAEKKANKRVVALENELGTLRTEPVMRSAPSLIRQ